MPSESAMSGALAGLAFVQAWGSRIQVHNIEVEMTWQAEDAAGSVEGFQRKRKAEEELTKEGSDACMEPRRIDRERLVKSAWHSVRMLLQATQHESEKNSIISSIVDSRVVELLRNALLDVRTDGETPWSFTYMLEPAGETTWMQKIGFPNLKSGQLSWPVKSCGETADTR